MHYLTELDFDAAWTHELLEDARRLKADRGKGGAQGRSLEGRHVALYFEKPSVRTRTSFTVAVQELGGQVVELSSGTTKVGKGEHEEDFARVIGRYVHALVARVFEQSKLEMMASAAGVPVVNALSDERHPCQALADVLTILERKGNIEGARLCYVGEGNNVAASTGLLVAALGGHAIVASPEGFELPDAILEEAKELPGTLEQTTDPMAAAKGADALYTDTWVSMGDEASAAAQRAALSAYRIDDALLARAPEAIVLHCLPAVRGEEITREIMYSDRSAIWDQAENRLHVQKALLRRLLSA
jgi:ornithine carbamoyltransferase